MEHKVNTRALTLERNLIPEVIKAILHTILFHRYFGNVKPKEHRTLSSVTYVSVDDPDVIAAVDEKVGELMQTVSPTSDSKTQITLYFTETKSRRAWFSKTEEEIRWEEWVFDIRAHISRTEREFIQMQARAETQLKESLLFVISEMDRHKDHIPLIASTQGNPFPFHISVAPSAGLWSSMIKRAIRPV